MPESSAKQVLLNFFNPNKDLICAFFLKEFPVSWGDLIFLKSFKLKILKKDLSNRFEISLVLLLLFEKKINSFTFLLRKTLFLF